MKWNGTRAWICWPMHVCPILILVISCHQYVSYTNIKRWQKFFRMQLNFFRASGILPTWHKRVHTCLNRVYDRYVLCYSTYLLSCTRFRHVYTRLCQVGRIPDDQPTPQTNYILLIVAIKAKCLVFHCSMSERNETSERIEVALRFKNGPLLKRQIFKIQAQLINAR